MIYFLLEIMFKQNNFSTFSTRISSILSNRDPLQLSWYRAEYSMVAAEEEEVPPWQSRERQADADSAMGAEVGAEPSTAHQCRFRVRASEPPESSVKITESWSSCQTL